MADLLPPDILAFALAAIAIEVTPGPNMGYLAALTISNGIRAGAAAVAGVALGLAIYGVVAAAGLAAVVQESRLLYELLRWTGVAYLLWLAWEGWSSEEEIAADTAEERGGIVRTAFRRGLVTNLLNPKAAVFYVTVVPAFIEPDTGHVMGQALVLSALYVAIATAVHATIVLTAGRLHTALADPARRRLVRKSLALALAAIAVWFAITTSR